MAKGKYMKRQTFRTKTTYGGTVSRDKITIENPSLEKVLQNLHKHWNNKKKKISTNENFLSSQNKSSRNLP
jgi:hypothetical protein